MKIFKFILPIFILFSATATLPVRETGAKKLVNELWNGAEWFGNKVNDGLNHIDEIYQENERRKQRIRDYEDDCVMRGRKWLEYEIKNNISSNDRKKIENEILLEAYKKMKAPEYEKRVYDALNKKTHEEMEQEAEENEKRKKEEAEKRKKELKYMKEQMQMEEDVKRKTRLEENKQNNKNEIEKLKLQQQHMLKMIERLRQPSTVAFAGGATLAIAGMYYGSKYAYDYFSSQLDKPQLIKKTSLPTFKERMLGKKKPQSRMKEMVVNPDLQKKLDEVAARVEMSIKDGDGVPGVLFTGPAGTGKTMFAEAMAYKLNQQKLVDKKGKKVPVNYMMCSGSDFAQFTNGKDIQEMNKIYDYAMGADGITVLFIDEIDVFLPNRLNPNLDAGDKKRVNKFLSLFDKPRHDKILIIGATNFEHNLDKAAFARFSYKIGFKLPAGKTLETIFDNYVKKEIIRKRMSLTEDFKARKAEIVSALEGLSPRAVEDLCVQIYYALRMARKRELDAQLALDKIADQKEAEKRNSGEIIITA